MVPKKLLLDYFGQADGGPSVRLGLVGDASHSSSNMRLGGECEGDCGCGMCDLGRDGGPRRSLRQVGRECGGDCGCADNSNPPGR